MSHWDKKCHLTVIIGVSLWSPKETSAYTPNFINPFTTGVLVLQLPPGEEGSAHPLEIALREVKMCTSWLYYMFYYMYSIKRERSWKVCFAYGIPYWVTQFGSYSVANLRTVASFYCRRVTKSNLIELQTFPLEKPYGSRCDLRFSLVFWISLSNYIYVTYCLI